MPKSVGLKDLKAAHALAGLRVVYDNMVAAYPLAMAGKSFEKWQAELSTSSDFVEIGFAQEMANGKLLFIEGVSSLSDIHDSGKPVYRLYRSKEKLSV